MAESKKRGVLFDVDGTLIDSSYFHAFAWWQAFRREGLDVQISDIHRCVGMGGDKLVRHLVPDCTDELEEELKSAHGAVFSTFWPSLRAFEAARDLLAACSDAGLAVGLASSAQQRDLDVSRKVLDAGTSIDAWTSSNDAEASKPEPDILLACLDKLGLRPEDVVFVGDAVWDVKAAGSIGIPAIALTCGGISEGELRDAGAAEVYDNPRHLLENLESSAIGKLAR
ncbi:MULTISPECIES: HAD family hydrolase [Paenarthrobacter]|uniref:HAD family hydrolase n=1 Tax=Paenarthrobacter ureafaciens TaxID=37931 RepID=A0AAX3EHB1_PAEUR|nr:MULTISPECIES: HAD family hydrolase [Paenarthrobacter]AMB42069.1 HAD family hydrolase [Arthrobacter sp. ATCC 21022]NKR13669.1 HAD family hydrolase [Arthrobacter sp. M5]NKR17694.1 HAD family hydrolase [Arthrobacter sp. M6]OEH58163.1 HAD family hydrolase [Arthrobacter sp. D4]OEH58229.1 HAD family hydrolase [Arthrobacter sp. D2]